jgi:type II secretory ATPase GspE/PulE/Tfp pilus assembly ATPase PilB-like protein
MSLFLRFRFLVFSLFLCVLALFSLSGQECYAQAQPPQPQPMMQPMQPQPAAPKPLTTKDKLKKVSDDILKTGWWGPGGYFSPIKLLLYIILFLIWGACTSWINADQERLRREKREVFNLVLLLLYGVVGMAIFFIPLFWVAFSLTALICFVPTLTYVVIRNQKLPPGDKVLTREHLWFLFATVMGKIGVKIQHGQRLEYTVGPPVELEPLGKGVDPQILHARQILARNAAGYNLLRDTLYDAVQSRATAIRFDFSPEETKHWHLVDGVWLELVPVPRKLGRSRDLDIYEEMQDAAKKLIGGNPEDRRSKQGGKFKAAIGNPKKKSKMRKFEVDYMSQGTPTGEAAMFQLHAQTVSFKTLDEIGVRAEMQTKMLQQINLHADQPIYGHKGFVLVSAPPAHGLRSTMSVFSHVCDRFTRDVANIEDVNGASEPVENVIRGMYDSSKGETPDKQLADLLFRGIAVLFVRDMSSPGTIKICCDELQNDARLFLTMIRAKDGVETLQRFLAVGFPAQQVVPYINSTICQRLIRVLCPECKEAYEPDPKTLQQLRLNPSQVQQLFRKRTPLPPHEEARRGICHKCHGVGYFGRTALFELLTISDETKALLLAKANPATLRQQFNKEGQQTFLHEGIRLLLKGETSIEELSRVLKM